MGDGERSEGKRRRNGVEILSSMGESERVSWSSRGEGRREGGREGGNEMEQCGRGKERGSSRWVVKS